MNDMVEVIFLGVGGALPMRGQTNSAFVVRAEHTVILVDCGPAILQQFDAVEMSPGEITHVFFTHRHGDHLLGYPMFLLWWALQRPPDTSWPTIIAGQATWTTLDALLSQVYGDLKRRVTDVPRIAFADDQPFTLDLPQQARLRTQPLQHSAFAPVSGLRLELAGKVVAFTGDTAPCEGIVALARDADLLVHEAAYSATLHPELAAGAHGHSTARSAARYAAAANARQLALVHLDARYAGQEAVFLDEASEEFPGTVYLPSAGDIYTL
jgi:ribonuclease Z